MLPADLSMTPLQLSTSQRSVSGLDKQGEGSSVSSASSESFSCELGVCWEKTFLSGKDSYCQWSIRGASDLGDTTLQTSRKEGGIKEAEFSEVLDNFYLLEEAELYRVCQKAKTTCSGSVGQVMQTRGVLCTHGGYCRVVL